MKRGKSDRFGRRSHAITDAGEIGERARTLHDAGVKVIYHHRGRFGWRDSLRLALAHPDRVRSLVLTDPELSQLLLRAFILRRTLLMTRSAGNVSVVESGETPFSSRYLPLSCPPFDTEDDGRFAIRDALGFVANSRKLRIRWLLMVLHA